MYDICLRESAITVVFRYDRVRRGQIPTILNARERYTQSIQTLRSRGVFTNRPIFRRTVCVSTVLTRLPFNNTFRLYFAISVSTPKNKTCTTRAKLKSKQFFSQRNVYNVSENRRRDGNQKATTMKTRFKWIITRIFYPLVPNQTTKQAPFSRAPPTITNLLYFSARVHPICL